jgi:hypothetical protein
MKQPKRIHLQPVGYTPTPEFLATLEKVKASAFATSEGLQKVAEGLRGAFATMGRALAPVLEEMRKNNPQLFINGNARNRH